MTNTYSEDEPHDVKLLEEMRCIRSVMERILRVMDEGLFVDYQMEKFTGRKNVNPPLPANVNPHLPANVNPPLPATPSLIYQTNSQGTVNPCAECSWTKELRDRYHNNYVGDAPCQWCKHGPKVIC